MSGRSQVLSDIAWQQAVVLAHDSFYWTVPPLDQLDDLVLYQLCLMQPDLVFVEQRKAWLATVGAVV